MGSAGTEHTCASLGVIDGERGIGDADHQVDRKVEPGLDDVVETFNRLLGGDAFAKRGRGFPGSPLSSPEWMRLIPAAAISCHSARLFLTREVGRAVGGDAFELGETFVGGTGDLDQRLGWQSCAVPVGEERHAHRRPAGLESAVEVVDDVRVVRARKVWSEYMAQKAHRLCGQPIVA